MIDKLKSTARRVYDLKFTLIKFGIVGALGIIVNQGVLALLVSNFGWSVEISGIISIELSIISNFLLNNYWTWNHSKKYGFVNRFLKYHLITLFSGGVNYVVLLILTNHGMHYLLANMIGICFGIIINFSINHLWTFKKGELI